MEREEAIEKVREMKLSPGKDAELIIALHTLIPELRESEDERIRKDIIKYFTEIKSTVPLGSPNHFDRYIAYLEKQKEKSKNITANLLEDGITGIQRELIEFLANSIDASWVDVIKSADAYAQRIRSMVEKQKEQKPADRFEEAREKYQVEWSDNDDQLIGFIFDLLNDLAWRKDWAMSKEECLERLKSISPQPKQEWSEEDEKMRINILNALTPQLVYSVGKGTCTGTSTYKYDDEIKWLKSLRPSWKPSEEQMRHLHYALTPGSVFDLDILKELYEQLKKLM